MLWRISKKFNFAAERIIPDSLVFCILLSGIAFVVCLITAGFDAVTVVQGWFNGLSSMNAFTTQIIMMIVFCGTAAKAPQVVNVLRKISKIPKTPTGALIFFMIVIYLVSIFNWAFGTILSPVLAMYLSKRIRGLHFPMMVVGGYAMMIQSQVIAPATSAYALVATPGHFLEDVIGVVGQDLILFNPVNLITCIAVTVAMILVTVLTHPPKDEIIELSVDLDMGKDLVNYTRETDDAPATRLNNSRFIMLFLGFLGLFALALNVYKNGFMKSMTLNWMILAFMVLDAFLYDSPSHFMAGIKSSMVSSAEVLVQFPLYGALAGMMQASGLAGEIANLLATIANGNTFYMLSFWSAAFLNLFIPGQGGQFIVQGPILMNAGKLLHTYTPYVMNAFVNGDECTNLLQPLWALPALAMVQMKLKDVWGLMAFLFLFWFIIASILLYALPQIFAM
jgi:short-chain fatty acids transporter